MKINIIASTGENNNFNRNDLDIFSGHVAGICYSKNGFYALKEEPLEKTLNRAKNTLISGHHSVYDHSFLSLYLEDVPKIIAMFLNNEKQYTTSEKSARYTKMNFTEQEKDSFDKWQEIFKDLIGKKYNGFEFFTPNRIRTLAHENARYLTSVFTPTSLMYTTSYRQINYLYNMFQREIEKNSNKTDSFYTRLNFEMQNFCDCLKELPFINEKLNGEFKNRELSLMNEKTNREIKKEIFDDVYLTTNKMSLSCLAQAQRHRTLDYSFRFRKEKEVYIPKILKNDQNLVKEWQDDFEKNIENTPQGLLVDVNERGTLDNFKLKLKERLCTFTQVEINDVTKDTLKKYVTELAKTKHDRLDELEKFTHGSRCLSGEFKCNAPCNFIDGIKGEREI